jgi:ubiquinone/menaquinone biosynthesis C-methylase UbiE
MLLLMTGFLPAAAFAQNAISNARLFDAVGVHDGSTVCEIGAGDGAVTIAAAKVTGPRGHVYSSELGSDRVQSLRSKVGDSGLPQITVVSGDAAKTNFPDAGCDAVFMRDVYHHLTNPAAMNGSILLALKPGAKLAIVDFTPPPGSEAACPADRGKDGMHGITLDTLSRELKDAGFEAVSAEQLQRALFVVVARPTKQL